uniref:rho guanine nucleotide exchange factor TIAM1-like isoform X2 n=1 Tax=Myxine glutinosa TaxID=7769 RepID=UPI00358EF3B7
MIKIALSLLGTALLMMQNPLSIREAIYNLSMEPAPNGLLFLKVMGNSGSQSELQNKKNGGSTGGSGSVGGRKVPRTLTRNRFGFSTHSSPSHNRSSRSGRLRQPAPDGVPPRFPALPRLPCHPENDACTTNLTEAGLSFGRDRSFSARFWGLGLARGHGANESGSSMPPVNAKGKRYTESGSVPDERHSPRVLIKQCRNANAGGMSVEFRKRERTPSLGTNAAIVPPKSPRCDEGSAQREWMLQIRQTGSNTNKDSSQVTVETTKARGHFVMEEMVDDKEAVVELDDQSEDDEIDQKQMQTSSTTEDCLDMLSKEMYKTQEQRFIDLQIHPIAMTEAYCSQTLPCRRQRYTAHQGNKTGKLGALVSLAGTLPRRKSKEQQILNQSKCLRDGSDSGIEGAATDSDFPSKRSSLDFAWSPSIHTGPCEAEGSDSGSSSLGMDVARCVVVSGEGQHCTRGSWLGGASCYGQVRGLLNSASGPGPTWRVGGSVEDESPTSACSEERLGCSWPGSGGAVRRAGWLGVKSWLARGKGSRLELCPCRRWKLYWAALKGCALFLYGATEGAGIEPGVTQPCHMLSVQNAIVQAVPEHPKRENVFCLSNSFGDVYLMQIQQWERNLEGLQVELFRHRCYLASLQGEEPPNPKPLLSMASRSTKLALARLASFSVSSLHALVCSRDDGTIWERPATLSRSAPRKKGLFSSLRGSDSLNHASHRTTTEVFVGENNYLETLEQPPCPFPFSEGTSPCTDKLANFDSTKECTSDGLDHAPLRNLMSEHLPAKTQTPGPPVIYVESPVASKEFVTPDVVTTPSFCPAERKENQMEMESGILAESTTSCVEAETRQVNSTDVILCSALPTDIHLRQSGPFPGRSLSPAERLWKVILELVETESTYVKDLTCLIESYLEPLQRESFLTTNELASLFGNLREMVLFQRVFLETLEHARSRVPSFHSLLQSHDLRAVLLSLARAFLHHAEHFKLYGSFCASHARAQALLARAKADPNFRAFLEQRNPQQQHSSTLESYLIKPIQRILKYPLLLRELRALTDPDSDENCHLEEACKAMSGVASHINEMQKIYDEFGIVFDRLVEEQPGPQREVSDLSMGELLITDSVVWLNPPCSLRRCKRELGIKLFAFKQALVLICHKESEKGRKRGSSLPRLENPVDGFGQFRFWHMVPAGALQVRAGSVSPEVGMSCIWELVHMKSELEGRPETVFHLCSHYLAKKLRMVRVLGKILRDRSRHRSQLSLPTSPQSSRHSQQLTSCPDAPPTSRLEASVVAPTQTKELSSPLSSVDSGCVLEPAQEDGIGRNNSNNEHIDAAAKDEASAAHCMESSHLADGPRHGKDLEKRLWTWNLMRISFACDDMETDILSDEGALEDRDEQCDKANETEENKTLEGEEKVMDEEEEIFGKTELTQNFTEQLHRGHILDDVTGSQEQPLKTFQEDTEENQGSSNNEGAHHWRSQRIAENNPLPANEDDWEVWERAGSPIEAQLSEMNALGGEFSDLSLYSVTSEDGFYFPPSSLPRAICTNAIAGAR